MDLGYSVENSTLDNNLENTNYLKILNSFNYGLTDFNLKTNNV